MPDPATAAWTCLDEKSGLKPRPLGTVAPTLLSCPESEVRILPGGMRWRRKLLKSRSFTAFRRTIFLQRITDSRHKMILHVAQAEGASQNDGIPSESEAPPIFLAVTARLKSCPVTKP